MYSAEYLSTYPYFAEILKTTDLSTVLDSLTGVVTRSYTIRFIRYLIDCRVPFTLAMLDLDNFKQVNDAHGHKAGDSVLSQTAENMRDYLGGKGIVGRIGGDEFLIVNLHDLHYDDVHTFFDLIYDDAIVLRKTLDVYGEPLFVTGTIGCATYPTDALDYDTLFAKIDKTLYRGKSKGRNCFIIYVESKHSHLSISTLARQSLYETLRTAAQNFDECEPAVIRMARAFAPIAENFRMHKIYYVNRKGELKEPVSGTVIARDVALDKIMTGDMYSPPKLNALINSLPTFTAALEDMGFWTCLISRVEKGGVVYGYIVVLPEQKTVRMWQDDEEAAIYFISRLLATYLSTTDDTFD